jgi:hypothetical protein
MNPEPPPDTSPGAVLLRGLRRGALVVWLPLALAGQAVAWIAFAISGSYGPWSWVKIGLGYSLLGLGAPFETAMELRTGVVTGVALRLTLGAFTVAALVLAFRAGRDQASGLERRPLAAALAGASIASGVAVPVVVSSLLVSLTFPGLGLTGLRPEPLVGALAAIVLTGSAAAIGGLGGARGGLEAHAPWGPRAVAAARAGFTALWWGVALAFVGFLLVAALRPGATGAYARFLNRQGTAGALVVVHHALLLPNQSAVILAASMGVPVDLEGVDPASGAPEAGGARLTYAGIQGRGGLGSLVGSAEFPVWFAGFFLVPAFACFQGGRVAATGVKGREAMLRATLGGLVFAVLAGLTSLISALLVPAPALEISLSMGADPLRTALLAAPWGIAAGLVGSRWPARERLDASPSPR